MVLALIIFEGIKDAVLWPLGQRVSRRLGVRAGGDQGEQEEGALRPEVLATTTIVVLFLGLVARLAWAARPPPRAGVKAARGGVDDLMGTPEEEMVAWEEGALPAAARHHVA